MIYKKILLKDIDKRFDNESATLRIYISERNESVQLRPGLLICPGGGYTFCSPREAEPIAFRFLSEGFNCFILNYTVNKKYPAPHLELGLVLSYIRQHEKEFDLIPNSLSIVGFSAGGHLVGTYGYLYQEIAKELLIDSELIRPRAIIMGYPVTLMDERAHRDTREVISGGDKELMKKLDIPSHVDNKYPPTFLWATKDDEMVPVINTTLMEKALESSGITYECHVFESGRHGGAVANRSCYSKMEFEPKMNDYRDWASKASDFVFKVIDNEQ